jgi:hypothetical protein
MQQLPAALAALDAHRQFVPYFLTPSKRRAGKMEKVPYGSTTDPATWLSYREAMESPKRHDGVGFVFSERDGFWFLDIDNCVVDGDWSQLAKDLMGVFSGCALEVSQSGTGLHIIGTGQLLPHGCRNKLHGLELYHTGRFVALTGLHASGDVRFQPSQQALDWLVTTYFPLSSDAVDSDGELTTEPVPEWNGPTDDAELIRRALSSKKSAGAAFGDRAGFADLWHADPVVLAAAYPPDPGSDDPFGRSEADAALIQHLCFWTGNHGERIERIMRQSALARDKWDDRDGYYLPRSITRAAARQTQWLNDKPVELVVSIPATGEPVKPGGVGEIKPVDGSTFVGASDQAEFFKGCTYVVSAHRILTPDGSMLRPEQFRAKYGGYSFPMDDANQRLTRNAWECFTESQIFRAPKADATMFRPDLPPGYISHVGGYSRVNSYVPVAVERVAGDASPFLDHMARVIPDERDRTILLSWLAAVVQYPGKKLRWAPLIQGAPGNGKTLFTLCLIHAIGERYCHLPTPDNISEKFNSWLFDKMLIGVEDVYTSEFKGDLMEVLKPMITGEFLSKRAMQSDQVMQNSVANFIFNTNHKDGLRKDRNDRRIAPFFCPQQSDTDLIRDGLTQAYFVKLYRWLESGGYAIVSHFLATYEIPDEFNPATNCVIAPTTTSTLSAIQESLGGVEQSIQEALALEQIGFRGGFISSEWLARLLEKMNASRRITHNRRRDLLEPLGYIMHPALHEGRVTKFIMPDGSKSRLFVLRGSAAAALTTEDAVIAEYQKHNYAPPA